MVTHELTDPIISYTCITQITSTTNAYNNNNMHINNIRHHRTDTAKV